MLEDQLVGKFLESLQNNRIPLSKINDLIHLTNNSGGVYLIIYTGKHSLYQELYTESGLAIPVYIGRASFHISKRDKGDVKKSIHVRLTQHLKSIQQTTNLDDKDFFVSFILMSNNTSHWAEQVILSRLGAPWNKKGFGNKGEKARKTMTIWDQIHPGREHSKSKVIEKEYNSNLLLSEISMLKKKYETEISNLKL